MLLPFTLAAVSFLGAAAPVFAPNDHKLFANYGAPNSLPPFSIIKEFETPVETPDLALREEEPKRLICRGCNDNENRTLAFFQERGITDKNALATIMGNIKQESGFVPNVCEGGHRTTWGGCTRGGYGLIQWTSTNRYNGLGRFAQKYGGKPSHLETQLRYLVNEVQWQRIESHMKTPGYSINSYMNAAYSWIGWGIHGARTYFAQDYARRFTWNV